ncbi:MAG: hypothetical protein AABZ34_16395 [Nitrospirota bacterium]
MPDSASDPRASQAYGWLLLGLLLLFLFRVVTQLVQSVSPVAVLPSFEAWQSGALPYPLLVAFQLLILVACARVVWSVLSGTVVSSAKKGRRLLALGWVYFIAMGIRLVVGLTIASDHFWFGATLPTLFHLVLACFLLVWGAFHTTSAAGSAPPAERGAL